MGVCHLDTSSLHLLHLPQRPPRPMARPSDHRFQTLIGDTLLDRRDQPAAPGAVVGFPQDCKFRRDGTVRSAQHIGSGGPIYIAKKSEDGDTKNRNTDQIVKS
jgi:hypothetical protein